MTRTKGRLDPVYDRVLPLLTKAEPWLFVGLFLIAMIAVGTIESGGK